MKITKSDDMPKGVTPYMPSQYLLDAYEPRRYMRYFEEITRIPHDTEDEAHLAAYIREVAKTAGLESYQDPHGNVLVRMPATEGYENAPAVLFQGHMDMVCVKDEGVVHDFSKDALDLYLYRDADYGVTLAARGTSLGADNGVGLAMMLTLMTTPELLHPPLEFLFTVEEESGLWGARKFDYTQIRARHMINMDSGDADMMCVCSTGAVHNRFHMTYKTVPHRGTVYSGTIGGLLGGHSGNDIAKGRANAISLLGEFLEKLTGCENAWLIDADVQESQGIPDQATVRLCVESGEAEKQLRQLADMLQKSWRSAYRAAGEDNIALRLEQVEEEALVHDCISCEDLRKIGALLQGIPYGVIEYGGKNQSIPFCTGCTSRFCVKENVCQLWFSVRSLSEALKWDTEKSVKELASQLGADVEILDQYPGWPYRTDSPMQELCKKLFQEMYGEEIKIEYGQGGCEPGIIIDKLPDMDALGLAPTSRGAHTTRERFYLETVEPTYQLFVRMLRQIAENGI